MTGIEVGEQLDIFDLIPNPAVKPPEPVIHLRELPENYARVATNGHPWEWIVSLDHVIYGAGFCKTKPEAEGCITRTINRINRLNEEN